MAIADAASEKKQKIIVAVHGIGDQVRNETILATAIRFCDHYGYKGMLPLGAFHAFPPTAPEPGTIVVAPPTPPDAALFINDPPPFKPCEDLSDVVGFVEVHWADVARKISDDRYTLQETKAWAYSLVNRVRVLASLRNENSHAEIDYPRIALVLEEIIDAIRVIETLLMVSQKAGFGEFDLRKILDSFLGDVQLVTEFSPVRAQILAKFAWVMQSVAQRYPKSEIHIIAHSEGTVVSFLGLLEACDDPATHAWIRQVHGFVTLGSPIDKHLILWPRLFDRFKQPDAKLNHEIRWANYVDYGDPVGFDLDTARDWITARGYANVLKFDARDDYSFRRYPVPGKAHVDYWTDPEVFSHLIQTVVAPKPLTDEEAKIHAKGPPPRWWVPLVSYGVGYLLPLIVLHLGVYILCKAIYNYLDPKDAQPHPHFVATVLGLSWLVAGTTIWLRIVRLTRTWPWFALGLGIYALCAGGYYWLVVRNWVEKPGVSELAWFETIGIGFGLSPGLTAFFASFIVVALVLFVNAGFWRFFFGRKSR